MRQPGQPQPAQTGLAYLKKAGQNKLPRRCDSYVLAAFPELPGEKFAVCR